MCFLLVLKKGFKIKSQVANENWFVFFILKEKWTQGMIKLIEVCLRNKIKKNDHWIENQGLL